MRKYKLGLDIEKIDRIISRDMDAHMMKTIDGDKLTVSQAYVIDFILTSQKEDIFQKDLEKEFDLKRAAISLMLNNMEKNDLIKRVPVSEDARLKKIVLTEKAIALSTKIIGAVEVGFVVGIIPAKTPIGSAIFVIPNASSFSIIPQVLTSLYALYIYSDA